MTSASRFAIISPNFYPRVCGVGDNSLRLGQELQRRGHDVAIFSRAPADRHPEALGLKVYGVGGRLPTLVARNLAKAIIEYGPTEIVLQYTNQMWDAWRFGSPAVTWLMRRVRRTGARLTLIAHELFVPWLPRPDLALAALFQRVQFAMLLRACDRFFVTTDTRAQFITPLCQLLQAGPPEVLRIGSNALPIERRRLSDKEEGSALRIGFFSTAAVGKRYDVVLDAFAKIAGEISSAELILMGDLGPSDRPRVRTIVDAISRHPARARIRLTGKLSLTEIAAETARLDIYLFPMDTGATTRSSTLPVALGSGLPIVAISGPETDLALFRDGENIIFASEMSGPAFANAALRLLGDRAALARIGEGGHRLYSEHLSWERIGDRLLANE